MKKTLPFIVILILCIFFPIITGFLVPGINPPQPSVNGLTLPKDNPSSVKISFLNTDTDVVSQIALEEYLVGVLAAEMPAEYHPEALKAQAVAARSYILSRMEKSNADHPDAHVCTDPGHCKAWLSETEARAKWVESDRNLNWEKLKSAVSATRGEYMIYDNQVVEAFFFASSGGKTENSEDVWGGSRPYLKSVESYGDVISPDRESKVTVSTSQFASALGISAPFQFSNLSRTEGGSVATVEICGKTFKGTELRSIFGLKSANFTIAADADSITFTVLGYGHGVGMSQTGADYMAKSGQKYTEILSHYYTNIQIAKM